MGSIHQNDVEKEGDSGILLQENLRKLQVLRQKERRATTTQMREDFGRQIREVSDAVDALKTGVSIQPRYKDVSSTDS